MKKEYSIPTGSHPVVYRGDQIAAGQQLTDGPVVLQDTGFHSALPVGKGILHFRTMAEAAEAIHEVERDYKQHAEAARCIAEKYFDSDRVLTRLIEEALHGDQGIY